MTINPSVMLYPDPRLNLLAVDTVSLFQLLFYMLLVGPDSPMLG